MKRSDFTTPPFEPEGRYNSDLCRRTVGGLRSTKETCSLCGLIWTALKASEAEALDDAGTWSLKWAQNTNDYQPSGDVEDVEGRFSSALYPCLGDDRNYGIQLVDEKDTVGFLRGRFVGEKIDLKLVKDWLARCQAEHGRSCSIETTEDEPLSHLEVIDVDQLCICHLPAGEPYIALSYVWGETNTPVTLVSTHPDYSKSKGLDVPLPQTVQDSMDLVRALGLRYLWVDSLCIVQDGDPGLKQAMIESMDMIYSNAIMTLVAADAIGAHSGLSGWSNEQGRDQHCVQLGNALRLGILPYYQRELLECNHARRAWTYQETSLSPRCLVFLNGFVYFNCNKAVYAEHMHVEGVEGIEPEASANTLGKATSSEWAWARISQHIRAYSSRHLTYQADGLNAFAGIAKTLQTDAKGKLIYGMPASCFDWAILWTGRNSLVRRPHLPSWAWVGWEGEIHMSKETYDDYDQAWLIGATWVDWFIVKPGESGECELIWREQGLEGAKPFQSHMSQEASGPATETEGSPQINESDDEDITCPTYGTSMPGNLFGRKTYPDVNRLIPPHSQALSVIKRCSKVDEGLICFAAPMIILKAGPSFYPPIFDDFPMSPLFDTAGRKCGFLSVTNSRSWPISGLKKAKLALVSITSFGDLSIRHAAGLTSQIYESYGAEDHLNKYLQGLPDGVDHFDFLNVLFVEESDEKVKLEKSDGGTESVLVEAGVYEHAGVGFIYREALASLKEGEIRWEDIVMQ